MKRFLSLLLMSWVLLALSLGAAAQDEPASDTPEGRPGSDVGSSSKDSKIDLSPPANDSRTHPDGGVADDILEFRSYNPQRALKNIEVGDYYFKRKNYRAALSRYQEALEWKPRDAEATVRLGRVLEKLGQHQDAKTAYQEYLNILPEGPYAPEAKEALERLADLGKSSTKAATKK